MNNFKWQIHCGCDCGCVDLSPQFLYQGPVTQSTWNQIVQQPILDADETMCRYTLTTHPHETSAHYYYPFKWEKNNNGALQTEPIHRVLTEHLEHVTEQDENEESFLESIRSGVRDYWIRISLPDSGRGGYDPANGFTFDLQLSRFKTILENYFAEKQNYLNQNVGETQWGTMLEYSRVQRNPSRIASVPQTWLLLVSRSFLPGGNSITVSSSFSPKGLNSVSNVVRATTLIAVPYNTETGLVYNLTNYLNTNFIQLAIGPGCNPESSLLTAAIITVAPDSNGVLKFNFPLVADDTTPGIDSNTEGAFRTNFLNNPAESNGTTRTKLVESIQPFENNTSIMNQTGLFGDYLFANVYNFAPGHNRSQTRDRLNQPENNRCISPFYIPFDTAGNVWGNGFSFCLNNLPTTLSGKHYELFRGLPPWRSVMTTTTETGVSLVYDHWEYVYYSDVKLYFRLTETEPVGSVLVNQLFANHPRKNQIRMIYHYLPGDKFTFIMSDQARSTINQYIENTLTLNYTTRLEGNVTKKYELGNSPFCPYWDDLAEKSTDNSVCVQFVAILGDKRSEFFLRDNFPDVYNNIVSERTEKFNQYLPIIGAQIAAAVTKATIEGVWLFGVENYNDYDVVPPTRIESDFS